MNTNSTKNFWQKLVQFHLKYYIALLSIIVVGTIFFTYIGVMNLSIHTDFFSLYPPKHPYIKIYKEYRKMFGTANVLTMIVKVKEGDIYNAKTLRKIDRLTKKMLNVKGVNSTQVISLTHPKLKEVSVGTQGLTIKPMIQKIPDDPEQLLSIKKKVYENEGIRGFYVNPTDTATLIKAGFWEEGVDLKRLFDDVTKLKIEEEDENHEIHITGYPMLYAWIHNYSGQLINILFLTFGILAVLLFFYFRSPLGLFVPLLSGVLSAIWGLGFASLMGYHIDPLILVVPLLLSARALSHGVQSIERYFEEYVRLGDKNEAIVEAYGHLYKPSVIGILTDGLGVLTIAVSTIPLMRNLAFFSSFWVISIYVSTVALHPVLLTLLPPPSNKALRGRRAKDVSIDEIGEVKKLRSRPGDVIYTKICHGLVYMATSWRKWVVFAIVIVIIVGGGALSRQLKVGDTSPGKAILYDDHEYNVAAEIVNKEFVGASEMIVVAAGKEPGTMKDAGALGEVLSMQAFGDSMQNVGGTVTVIDIVKRLNRMYHEGDPKWAMLPENPVHLAQMFFTLAASMAPGEMDRWVSLPEYQNCSITMYFQKLDHGTIMNAIEQLKGYISENMPEKLDFRLVGGVMGILAAVNEEVEWSYWVNLGIIFLTTFIICIIAYRSVLTAVILIIPLLVSQILCEILMLVLGIDVNINSLPIAAVGVGVGIDYSFFIMSRLAEEYHKSEDYFSTHYAAVTSTGKAVVFTATTMVAGTILWVFSSFKFQAEMGILLSFLMVVNAIGALVILPVLVAVFGPKILLRYKVASSETVVASNAELQHAN